MKRMHKVLIGVGVVFVGIVVAASVTGSPTPDAPAAAAPTSAADDGRGPAGAGTDSEYCRMTDGGGSYVLKVSSAAAHDFSVCAGGTVDPSFNLDTALSSGWDRRCLTATSADVEAVNAAVGVYSDGKRADVAAAKAFCTSQGWSNS